jgi:hypothetical protein
MFYYTNIDHCMAGTTLREETKLMLRLMDLDCRCGKPIHLARHRVTLIVEAMVRLQVFNVISRPLAALDALP